MAEPSEEIRRLTEGAIDSALAWDEHTPDPDPSDPCPRCGSDQLNPTCPYCQMIDTFNRALTNADR